MNINRKVLNTAALGGPAAVILTLAGWLIAGMLPLPLGPGRSTQTIVHFFTGDADRVMVGFVLASLGVALILPMFALISVHLLRLEGRAPVMSFMQLGSGSITVLINMFPQMIFAIAAFRIHRTGSEIVMLNDLAWLLLFTGILPFMIQNVSIGIAILNSDNSVFPRWLAFLNFLVAFSFIPDPLAYFFKTGPFAWNGIFVFWLALTAYCVFLIAMSWACVRANASLADDAAAG